MGRLWSVLFAVTVLAALGLWMPSAAGPNLTNGALDTEAVEAAVRAIAVL